MKVDGVDDLVAREVAARLELDQPVTWREGEWSYPQEMQRLINDALIAHVRAAMRDREQEG